MHSVRTGPTGLVAGGQPTDRHGRPGGDGRARHALARPELWDGHAGDPDRREVIVAGPVKEEERR